MMKKKHFAFTFAELMVSLIVISVIAALLYPAITKYSPNTNKPLFQGAYRTLSTVIGEIVNTNYYGELVVKDSSEKLVNMTGIQLCTNFCNKTNIVAKIDESAKKITTDCPTLCKEKTLTTSNGMRWHFDNFDTGTSTYKITVDVNASNNNLTSVNYDSTNIDNTNFSIGIFSFAANKDEKKGIYTEIPSAAKPNGVFNKSHLKAQDTFWIKINKKGKIVDMSPAGWANIEDSIENLD